MTTHEVLVKARGLIAKPENWCARADDDGPYCAMGAVTAAVCSRFGAEPCPGEDEAYRALTHELGTEDLVKLPLFNDSHTHAEVLALFDRAIAATAPAPDMSWLKEPESVEA